MRATFTDDNDDQHIGQTVLGFSLPFVEKICAVLLTLVLCAVLHVVIFEIGRWIWHYDWQLFAIVSLK